MRYADDSNVYLASQSRAEQRLVTMSRHYLESELQLLINPERVRRPRERARLPRLRIVRAGEGEMRGVQQGNQRARWLVECRYASPFRRLQP